MQRYEDNLYHICLVCRHHQLSQSDIETVLNCQIWQRNEARTSHYYHSYKCQSCTSPKAFYKNGSIRSVQRYVSNSYHLLFASIHCYPSLPDIETILNLQLWQHNEAQMTQNHLSYEGRNCSSSEALCKDENDRSLQLYVNNSYHICFACINHHPSLADIETILNLQP